MSKFPMKIAFDGLRLVVDAAVLWSCCDAWSWFVCGFYEVENKEKWFNILGSVVLFHFRLSKTHFDCLSTISIIYYWRSFHFSMSRRRANAQRNAGRVESGWCFLFFGFMPSIYSLKYFSIRALNLTSNSSVGCAIKSCIFNVFSFSISFWMKNSHHSFSVELFFVDASRSFRLLLAKCMENHLPPFSRFFSFVFS